MCYNGPSLIMTYYAKVYKALPTSESALSPSCMKDPAVPLILMVTSALGLLLTQAKRKKNLQLQKNKEKKLKIHLNKFSQSSIE